MIRLFLWCAQSILVLCLISANSQTTSAIPSRHRDTQITFRYSPNIPASSVTVAGSFNDWNKSSYPLHLSKKGNVWEGTFPISPGVYLYRFVVNGSQWLPDPHALGIDDGNSNINSQLIVQPPDYDLKPAVVGDGIITTSAIYHSPTPKDIVRIDSNHLSLILQTRAHDVESCSILSSDGQDVGMHRISSDPLTELWRGTVALTSDVPLHYCFVIRDASTKIIYGKVGVEKLSQQVHWFSCNWKAIPLPNPPAWVRNAVFYQIFPDRFANGDASNDGPGAEPWLTPPTHTNRMGGDLQGVLEHWSYLKRLGINAIYFNPLFAADSNHGYDTSDYLHVDPRFGTNALLKEVISRAHENGWHVILDGVFNHTGVHTRWFKSIVKLGPRSPFTKWYFINHYPVHVKEGEKSYVSWFGVPTLPKLNLDNPPTRKFILHVADYWIHYAAADGWRLDAADQIDPAFWTVFRKSVKRTDPDAFIMGEVWGDAHTWMQGNMWDSVMNYPWRQAVLDFFSTQKLTPTQFDEKLKTVRDNYPTASLNVMFNLLGSQDTVRLATLFKGKSAQQNQAIIFQFTYPGVPSIYYGDEVGMQGGADPDDRRCMNWDPAIWNRSLLSLYKALIALRKMHPVLCEGTYQTLIKDDTHHLFGFKRSLKGQYVIVMFNLSNVARSVKLSRYNTTRKPVAAWLNTGASIQSSRQYLTITIPAHGSAVYGTFTARHGMN